MTNQIPPSPPQSTGLPVLSINMVKRAAIIATAIGVILNIVNHGQSILAGEPVSLLSAILVFASPFFVVLASQMIATRYAVRDVAVGRARNAGIFGTLLSRGFLPTALVIALTAVGINTALMASNNYALTSEFGPLPVPVLAQAFVLPLFFSALSLTLSYRRATHTLQGTINSHRNSQISEDLS
jgi:hypothetical protein